MPYDKPETLLYLRIAYVVSQLIQFGVMYFLSLKVKAKNDLTTLKYVEPKSAGSQEPGALVTTTNRDYDLAEISKQMRSTLMGVGMIAFMHLYLKYTQPVRRMMFWLLKDSC